MKIFKFLAALALCVGLTAPGTSNAQSPTPPEYHGSENWMARGWLLNNLVKANIENIGRLASFGADSEPWGSWPVQFNRHIDGIMFFLAGKVPGDRTSTAALRAYYGGRPDTMVTPVVMHYPRDGTKLGPTGDIWAWLPLPDFHNPERADPITGARDPHPATASDPTSWPAFWPDRLQNPDDPGWRGEWNGLFGKGVFNADQEVYYVIDDYTYRQFTISPDGTPNSQYGVFYPDPADSSRGGLGVEVQTRALQWANILAEDTMFLIYRMNNVGAYHHDSLFFNQFVNWGMPPEGDELAAFDPRLDIAYGWDSQGIGIKNGVSYELGYTGFAFLESPVRDSDMQDNDEDGIIDEARFRQNGIHEFMLLQIEHPDKADLSILASPLKFDGKRPPNRAAPLLGADSEAILADLGYDDGAIAELRKSGVV